MHNLEDCGKDPKCNWVAGKIEGRGDCLTKERRRRRRL